MEYSIKFTPSFEQQLSKIKRKDAVLFERLCKKLKELRLSPEHYKPLRGPLAGKRRVHVDPFIVIFEVEGAIITVHYIKHHDEAY